MYKLDEHSTVLLKSSPSGHNGPLSSIPGDTIDNNVRRQPSYLAQAQEHDMHDDSSTVMVIYQPTTAPACTARRTSRQHEQVGGARGAGWAREDMVSISWG